MSIGGASLDVTSPIGLPDRFSLVFKADGCAFPATSSGAMKSGSVSRSTEPLRPLLTYKSISSLGLVPFHIPNDLTPQFHPFRLAAPPNS